MGAILDNPSFTSSMMATLSRMGKSNLFIFPYWKGEKRDQGDMEMEIRSCVKNSVVSWVEIPEIMDMEAR